jgi:tRNA(Ile)-lysidine synthase
MSDGSVERVRARVRDGGLVPAGTSVLVLLSGGRDSVCLLDALVAVRGTDAVRALHVHHGLREDAEDDADHCVALCGRLGVQLDVERLDGRAGAGNVQAWARAGRYEAAERLASAGARIAAAHTRCDQVETILYRLAAAPGRRALLGMDAVRGRLVRPLLGTTRAETTAYCVAAGLPYRDDPSNATDAYARGRVRHGVVPALRAVHPAAEDNLLRTADLLRDEADVLDAAVDAALGGRDALPLTALAQMPPALARLTVRRLAEDATGTFCPRAPGRLDEILALGEGALDVGDGARAIVRAGILRFGCTPPLPSAAAPGGGEGA